MAAPRSHGLRQWDGNGGYTAGLAGGAMLRAHLTWRRLRCVPELLQIALGSVYELDYQAWVAGSFTWATKRRSRSFAAQRCG
jgi:hypothetical protein